MYVDQEYKLDEKEYFTKRKEEFKIEFKKLPPLAVPKDMDVSFISNYIL